jgi:outer membrane receptor protein involved in Fe transport
MKRKIPALISVLCTLPLVHLTAQTVAPPPASAPQTVPAGDPVIELSPFTVDATADKGYRAENTLAGSRLNTSLRDTPASISVFTREFLDDIGLNEIEKIIDYSVNSQINAQDVNSGPNANNMLGGANLIQRINVRGILSAQGIDYFKSITVNDGYRIDRYDDSRGPNSILFGVGDAGGIINQSSILATTNRTNGRLSLELGNYGTNRTTLRHNQVVVPRKLALAVAGVHQENGGWREPAFHDKDRLFATVTFTPTDRITIRATGETGREYRAVVAPFPAFDGALAWIDNRNARGVNAVTFTPNNTNPNAAQVALGVTSRNVARNATNRRFMFIENNRTFFDASGTFVTGSYNNPAVRAPDGTPGVSGVTLSFHDPALLPYDINSGGPGMYRDTRLANYTLSADWRITSRLTLNLSHNYQEVEIENPLIKGSTPMIAGEANRTLGVGGPANPYVGQLYIDAPWYSELHDATYRESRISLSYDFDPKWKWAGSHRFAGMYSTSKDTDFVNQRRLGLAGAPFNAAPQNINNLVFQRAYLDENNPGSFIAPDWRTLPKTVTTGGRTYDLGWIDAAAGTAHSAAEQKLDAKLLVAQSHFFQRRLITTVGYRVDEGDVTSFGYSTDPVLRTPRIDRDPAKATVDRLKGITRSQGVVLHVTDWLSLLGNRSSNIGIPTFTNKVLPTGSIPGPTQGKGEDYGFALNLLANRLSLKAVAFTTSQTGQTKSGGINAQYNLRNIRIADALESVLVGPGRPISAADWTATRAALTPTVNADQFDEDSKGYEFSAVANLTSNWRLTVNYSYTDRIRSNISGADAIPWYGYTFDGKLLKEGVKQNANGTFTIDPSAFASGGTVSKWIELGNRAPAANLATLNTSGNISVAEEIRDMIADINDDKLQNEQRWGLRPHRTSMFTAYDFTEGRLKGFSTGFGYRWQMANVIGRTASGSEIKGRAISAADLMLRYRHPVSRGKLRGTLSYQINVSNLFNQDGRLPQRFSAIPPYELPGGRGIAYSRFDLMEPRSIRLTTTLTY